MGNIEHEWKRQMQLKNHYQRKESHYTEKDIGTEVRSVIEGVEMYDEVIAVWLPNGKRIIGPSLKCAHIFARFSMIPAMMEVNERMQSHMNNMEDFE